MWIALSIASITVIAFVICLFFLPEIALGNGKKVKTYPFIPVIGGAGMLLFHCLEISELFSAFTEDTPLNPLKILILFLSMTVFSLILEKTGFFAWISGVVLRHTGGNRLFIFLALYGIISLLTVFTSNDIVILTFTPFICCFCKSAKTDAIPFLIMEFVAANTWSLFLMIGNPTNLYLSGVFEISFIGYIGVMVLPTILAGVTSLVVMLVLFRKKLKGKIEPSAEHGEIDNKPLMILSLIHLAGCVILLAISQYIGLQMWLLALMMAISAIVSSWICLRVQHRGGRTLFSALRGMPFEIIPFILGMFVLVLALDRNEFTLKVAQLLLYDPSVFSYGFLSLLASNLFNNIPMSVLFSRILGFYGSEGQIYATIIGSNLGAFVTPLGALAGIMWFRLLKQNHVKLSVLRFIGYGTLISLPSFMASLTVLQWELLY